MKFEHTALQGFLNAKYLDISQRRIVYRELRSDVAQEKWLHKGKKNTMFLEKVTIEFPILLYQIKSKSCCICSHMTKKIVFFL